MNDTKKKKCEKCEDCIFQYEEYEQETRDWFSIPEKYELINRCVMVPYNDFKILRDYAEKEKVRIRDDRINSVFVKLYQNIVNTIGGIGIAGAIVSTVIAVINHTEYDTVNYYGLTAILISILFMIISSVLPTDDQSSCIIITQIRDMFKIRR